MRVVMGWVLLRGGLTKLVTYLDGNPANNWTTASFLQNAIPQGNPLTGGITAGLPVAHGWVVDEHLLYAVLLFGWAPSALAASWPWTRS
jgi:thiosulfate dehydrogenase [quinone] large subunit